VRRSLKGHHEHRVGVWQRHRQERHLPQHGFITQTKGYSSGDFDYDNVINADDYFLIDSACLGQTGPLTAQNAILADWLFLPQKKKHSDGSAQSLFCTFMFA